MKVSADAKELLALCAIKGLDWHLLAREAQRPDGVKRLREAMVTEMSRSAREAPKLIQSATPDAQRRMDWVDRQLELAENVGARLVTVLDEEYPLNLRLIYNLPPFLFYRGSLEDRDAWSVAVVGTRQASADGLRVASEMARSLATAGVTVVSGLARGIDTAAHRGALAAGGRTVAVLGTGIRGCYPKENRELAERIAEEGALVSQFWPDSPPTRSSFPIRNITTSGISQGTIVVEASATSGAKMQARLALEHGKRVFLVRSLVLSQKWAQSYAQRSGVTVVEDWQDVLACLRSAEGIEELTLQRRQLAFDLG